MSAIGTHPDPAPDAETSLDVQVVASAAPGAEIIVYYCAPSAPGMVAGIAQAVDDKLRNPSVITISHAALELAVDPNAITAIEQSLADAVGLQITVCAASGDWDPPAPFLLWTTALTFAIPRRAP